MLELFNAGGNVCTALVLAALAIRYTYKVGAWFCSLAAPRKH